MYNHALIADASPEMGLASGPKDCRIIAHAYFCPTLYIMLSVLQVLSRTFHLAWIGEPKISIGDVIVWQNVWWGTEWYRAGLVYKWL